MIINFCDLNVSTFMVDLLKDKLEFLSNMGFKDLLIASEQNSGYEIKKAHSEAALALSEKVFNDPKLSELANEMLDTLINVNEMIDKAEECNFVIHSTNTPSSFNYGQQAIMTYTHINKLTKIDHIKNLVVFHPNGQCEYIKDTFFPSDHYFVQSNYYKDYEKGFPIDKLEITASRNTIICDDIDCNGKIEQLFEKTTHSEL